MTIEFKDLVAQGYTHEVYDDYEVCTHSSDMIDVEVLKLLTLLGIHAKGHSFIRDMVTGKVTVSQAVYSDDELT